MLRFLSVLFGKLADIKSKKISLKKKKKPFEGGKIVFGGKRYVNAEKINDHTYKIDTNDVLSPMDIMELVRKLAGD